jgi:Ca2+:H+ antiporter
MGVLRKNHCVTSLHRFSGRNNKFIDLEGPVTQLLKDIRNSPLLWLLAVLPALFVVEVTRPDAHVLLFVLAILSIMPLAALLSRATESVAARTGDTIGGLVNATFGNMTELLITLVALKAGQYTLVKASLAGVIVGNALFMLGAAFLLGGLRHRVQTFGRDNARLQTGMLLLATVALLIPSVIGDTQSASGAQFLGTLSVCMAVLLIVVYGLSLLFSLKTHPEFFGGGGHTEHGEDVWPIGLAVTMLAIVTIAVAFVSEVFVGTLEHAATAFGMTPAFVGFVIVALVGGAGEFVAALSAARKDRLDLSVGIALGSASQIALFVAPVLVLLSLVIGPTPMDLQFWPSAVAMMLVATATVAMVTSSGRSAWFVGVLLIAVYATFALTLYLLPPATG